MQFSQSLRKSLSSFALRQTGLLNKEAILSLPSMPAISPSYPHGPFYFKNREYLLIEYETDVKKLRRLVPWPLVPASNTVIYEWINMPDSSGFGSYHESGCVVPCVLDGQPVSYTLSMYLNDEPPTAAGRELWGFPKRHANPLLTVERDTLVGTLVNAGHQAAVGTMVYKHKKIDPAIAAAKLQKTSCNLRLIPDLKGGLDRAQLVGFNLEDVEILEAWQGPARLHFQPHVTAPASDLPVKKIVNATHMRTNLTLPHGRVLFDYNNPHLECPSNVDDDTLTPDQVLQAPSMPITAPSYPRQIDSFANREYLFFKYTTDRQALLENLPYNVEVNDENAILISWVRTEGTGLGSYNKFNVQIPCKFQGKEYLFDVMTVMDSGVALNAGREIFGQPCKYGFPEVKVERDSLVANLVFGEQRVVTGTTVFKHAPWSLADAASIVTAPVLNLKFIPGVDGKADIAQLIALDFSNAEIDTTSMHMGAGRLDFIPHVHAPVSDFPVDEQQDVEAYQVHVKSLKQKASVVYDYLRDE